MIVNCSLIAVLAVMFTYQIYTVKKYKDLNKTRESLVANITHDLKSPTRAQINILNLLLNGAFGKLNPKQHEMLELTCGSSKYMSNLVGTILTRYECSCSELKLNYSKFNLFEIVKSICAENEYLATDREQKISLYSEGSDFYITGDKLQIKRVIFNLLSNAINHGFKHSTIKINLSHADDGINFSISNRSYPICESDLKNMFREFSRPKNKKFNPTSTGLGLYVSKKIIDLHKGHIYAQSTKDGLCTFGFSLPCVKKEKMKLKT